MADGSLTLWMLYSSVCGGLIFVVALGLDRALRPHRRPTRWVWAGALASTVAVPVATLVGGPVDTLERTVHVALPVVSSWSAMAASATAAPKGVGVSLALLDRLLGSGWALASAAALVYLSAGLALLLRRARRWPVERVGNARVRVAPDAGPASIPGMRPAIVLPRWATCLDEELRDLVVAHERSHVERGDPWLLLASLVPVVLTPWNPAVHAIRHRLRLAIELDCDRRVLDAGASADRYGALLLGLQRRMSPSGALSLAFSATSPLERRLRALFPRVRRFSRARTAANLFGATVALLVGLWLPRPARLLSASPDRSAAGARSRILSCEGRATGPAAVVLDLSDVVRPDHLSLRIAHDLSTSEESMVRLSAPSREVYGWCDGSNVTLYLHGEWSPQEVDVETSHGVPVFVRTGAGLAAVGPGATRTRCVVRTDGSPWCEPEAGRS